MNLETQKFRAEVRDNYYFIRNLEEKGGVIDASISNKKQYNSVVATIKANENSTFSEVWQSLIGIKGCRPEYSSN